MTLQRKGKKDSQEVYVPGLRDPKAVYTYSMESQAFNELRVA